MKKNIFIAAVILFTANLTLAGTWTTLDYPGAANTRIRGIDGDNLVGYYSDNSGTHGFMYNGSTWTTIDAPGAPATYLRGIDGSNIVGYYRDTTNKSHAFIYNSNTWTNLDVLGAYNTMAFGIDGSNIVGSYDDHGFIYNGTNYITLDKPGSKSTFICGIEGEKYAGYTLGPGHTGFEGEILDGYSGFLFDGSSWTNIDALDSWGKPTDDTHMYGIDETRIVGRSVYSGIIYEMPTHSLTILNAPGAFSTAIWGIDGNKLVGEYSIRQEDFSIITHGFIYEIPEPCTLLLLGLGGLFLRKKSNSI